MPVIAKAQVALESFTTLSEIKQFRDQAEALRRYAKQVDESSDLQNHFAGLKLRAERKAGEVLELLSLKARSHDATHLADLGLTKSQSSRWQSIARIPDAEFEALIAEAFNGGRELTSASALKLSKRLTATYRPSARMYVGSEPGNLETTLFTTITVDPPWRYDNTASRGAAEDHYHTMAIAELAEVEIPAADDAHLYLWVTNNFFREAFALLDAWEFEHKTVLTWVKPQMGMGNYFRSATEHVLFATRGSLPTLRSDVVNWFQADRQRHSQKPDSFYDLVEQCSPGPYLEMFARRRRPGWASWGNEP